MIRASKSFARSVVAMETPENTYYAMVFRKFVSQQYNSAKNMYKKIQSDRGTQWELFYKAKGRIYGFGMLVAKLMEQSALGKGMGGDQTFKKDVVKAMS